MNTITGSELMAKIDEVIDNLPPAPAAPIEKIYHHPDDADKIAGICQSGQSALFHSMFGIRIIESEAIPHGKAIMIGKNNSIYLVNIA